MRCRMCGKAIEAPKQFWCSKACQARHRKKVASRLIECRQCGVECLVPPNSQRYRNQFCSQRCAITHYNQNNFQGPNNPNWRGGRAHSYGPGWKEIRQRVRERDRVCQRCGKTPEENGRALDVHHKGPHRFTGDNSMRNLVALCRSCHMRAIDHGRKGSVRFAGPQQLVLKPPSQRELARRRGATQRARREQLKEQAKVLRQQGLSLRQIGRRLGVSHQTIADWLS